MTRILQGFAFLCKLALCYWNLSGITKLKYERKNVKDSGSSSKTTPSCKWPILPLLRNWQIEDIAMIVYETFFYESGLDSDQLLMAPSVQSISTFGNVLIRNFPITVQIWSHVTRGLSFYEISVWQSSVVKHTRWKNNQIWQKIMNPFITRWDEPFAVKERHLFNIYFHGLNSEKAGRSLELRTLTSS